MADKEKNEFVRQVADQKYEFGFTTNVHTDIIDKGLNEDVVRLISQKKQKMTPFSRSCSLKVVFTDTER